MNNADPNQTVANRPPATHELDCRKCGGSFLGDEHHQFCGGCVVEVAREIAEMQCEVQPDVGNYRGSNILAWLNLPERGGLYEYVGIAVEDRSGAVALNQLASDEVVVFPGLIYRRVKS